MAQLGRRNLLPILREVRPGVYLDGGDRGEILLPRRYVPEGAAVGDEVDVFLYRDSEDRLVATTETPLAMVGEFAVLRVLSMRADIGAFLDWGLSKDLFLPRREQTGPIRVGGSLVVRVLIDEKSDRIIASARLHRFLGGERPSYKVEQAVPLLIIGETPLGYKAVVDGAHEGLLYHAEVSTPLRPGEARTGYVRAVRPDGKIDLSLDRAGYVRVKPLSEKILEALQAADGRLPFHDKSTPTEIRETFGVSKKAFKQALGALYRQKRIAMEANEIRLLSKSSGKG